MRSATQEDPIVASTAGDSEGNGVLEALAEKLLQLSAKGTPSAATGLGTPRTCTTATGSLRHLNALCRAYHECLLLIRADLGALIVGARELPPAESFRLSSSVIMRAGILLRWDVVLERTSYVGPADSFRQLGRSLGHVSCQRLAYCCSSAADDPGIEPEALLHWIDAPGWFAEVEQAQREKTRRHLFVVFTAALAGGLVFGWCL